MSHRSVNGHRQIFGCDGKERLDLIGVRLLALKVREWLVAAG